jgi:hypothetical protein
MESRSVTNILGDWQPTIHQRLGVLGTQVRKEGGRSLRGAVAVGLHLLDRAGLQADRRVVDHLLAIPPQAGLLDSRSHPTCGLHLGFTLT